MTSKALAKGDEGMRIATSPEVGIGCEGQPARARSKRIETYERELRSIPFC